MAEGLVHAELLAACSSLGYSDGVHYHREADCLETTKDLLRYLRRDDESHEVRRALGDTRVLQTDLLPLLQEHNEDEELLQLVVRLMVDLTNPVLLLFREEMPEEKVTRKQYLQMVRHQQGYKEAFISQKAWEAMAARLRALLEIPKEDREEDDRLLLERLLVLVRNVLWAPASPEEGRTDDDASIHDQVLWAMHLSGMAELLLYMTTSLTEHDFSLHLMEIISLMLREQDATWLATANLHRSEQEKEEDNRKLEQLRQQEVLQREAKRRAAASRHSRFGGTYVVRQVKSISEQDLILHRPLTHLSDISFDRNKKPRKHNKNRLPMREATTTRRSTLAVRIFLQEFCAEFLAGAYNAIMATVKDSLDRARAQDHDETYYLWAIRFFMEFNRHYDFKVELVTETLSIETFHFIQTHIENYFEMMAAEKKKLALWSRRMHRALRAYQELLATLAHMDTSPSQDVRESSRVLKSRLFYVVEYREMMLLLLQNYDPIKMSMGYLRDAVEATHTFLKLLEGICKQGRHVIVQGKGRKAPKKKTKAAATPGMTELTQEQLQALWDEVSPEVAAVVQGEAGNLPDVVPFDALSEDPEELQKEVAMRRISKHLREKELPQAVSLLRAAREVWPEGNIFGPQESDHTQDFLTLQEIFMANLSSPQETPVEELEEEEEEEEEEEVESMAVMTEQEFDFIGFVRRFANTKVVKAYSSLLHHYPTNTKHTNHCILKLFHRLAWDCKLPAIFFQASLFIVFLKAMEDPLRASSESPREIARFGKYIMRQLCKVAETNPKVFVELLFWKTNKEAVEIECGYGEQESGKQAAKQAWREEEEEELKMLHEEVEQIPPEERGEKDIVDLIMERLISRTRSRRSVIKKLKELGLIRDLKELRHKAPRISAPRTWTEEEEEELRRLFQENKEAMDIVGRIMDNMALRRPKHRVVEKILELGLVEDRKELRKKRPKKATTKPSKRNGQDFLAANQASDDEANVRSGSEATSESENEEEEEGNTDNHQVPRNSPLSSPVHVATPALISQALNTVLGAGLGEAVEWLARILCDVADDRAEDGDFEPVPILAITQACTNAMEDEEFHKLLRLVGLQPPKTHQEMFWRVPSRLSVAGLRKRAQYLTQGVSGGLQDIENPDEPLEPVEEVQPAEERSQNGKRPWKSKKLQKPKNNKSKAAAKVSSSPQSSEDKEDCFSGASLLNGEEGDEVHHSTPHHLIVDGESSEDDAPLSSLTARSNPSSLRPGSRVNKRELSDEDSDELSSQRSRMKEKKKKKCLVLDSDSEEENDLGERNEEEVEGEEVEQQENEGLSQTSKKQRIRAVIDSDDE